MSDSDAAPEPAAPQTRCGYVALVGAPNAGKSSLSNRLIGGKVSIVSPKVQTTRTKVLGIGMVGDSQLVLVDTPGIFQPKKRLERAMVSAALAGADDADVIVLVVDAARRDPLGVAEDVLNALRKRQRKAILALNKIDLMPREKLLALAQSFDDTGLFSDVFMVSAETGSGVTDLGQVLAQRVPAGPWLYDPEQLSDMPARLMAAEITREKLFLYLHEELPYSLTVETDTWTEQGGTKGVRIEQTIYVQRDSQKKIVLGAGGSKIRHIGSEARKDIAELIDQPAHLFLFVKVRQGWQDDRERYEGWGLDYDA
jgi:GTPase